MLRVRLLGAFEISRDGDPVALSSRAAQSLLAYLILNAGTAHRRERLAGLLWPDSPEESARDYLRHALWRIRKALPADGVGSYLLTDDLSISFDPSTDYWLDSARLERAGEKASTEEPMTALTVYQGELLPGFYDEWVILEREHLSSIYEHHMARLMSLLQEERRWLDILDWGERWIRLGQRPEPAYRALMAAHAAKGDMSKVAATYERCVKALSELGLEPSVRTSQLYEDLKSGRDVPKSAGVGEEPGEKDPNPNLPVPLTSFIGRKHELKEIIQLLSTSRLLTLTGPGGVGKTRLAIQIAHEQGGQFKDGISWADLVGVSDPDLIPRQIAKSLGVREAADEALIKTLIDNLKSRELLLAIDNCQHLIEAVAQIAERLLAACPNLRILATSRERMGISGEIVWQVPSLSENTSRQLFEERAHAVRPDFVLTESNQISVAEICQRLDRIPLAIELAAAHVAFLSVAEIDTHLDDRFSLLTSGNRTALRRQQTLRATIDWSYDLLSQPERILLRRLSIFAGGFTLDAAETVCAGKGEPKKNDVLVLLGRLTGKSLLMVQQAATSGGTRYRLLETIREYALEKLARAEETTLRDQHLDYYLHLAEQAEPHIYDRQASIWVRLLDLDFDNMRAALDWAANSGQAIAVFRITGSLVEYWFTHGELLSEWYRRVEAALSSPEGLARTSARAKALNGMGFLYWGDLEPADRRPQVREALAIGRELGDKYTVATALLNLGMIANEQGDYTGARVHLEESLSMWQEMGDAGKQDLARTLHFLGDTCMCEGDGERAESYYGRAAVLFKELGNRNILAFVLRRLAQLAWRAGDTGKAKPLCRESLLLNYETDDPRAVIACMAAFADIAVVEGRLEQAACLLGAVEALLTSFGLRLLRLDQMDYDRFLALLNVRRDQQTLSSFWSKGVAMSFEEATTFALEEA